MRRGAVRRRRHGKHRKRRGEGFAANGTLREPPLAPLHGPESTDHVYVPDFGDERGCSISVYREEWELAAGRAVSRLAKPIARCILVLPPYVHTARAASVTRTYTTSHLLTRTP